MISISDKGRALHALHQERANLERQAAQLNEQTKQAHAAYVAAMQELTAMHERVINKMGEIETYMVGINGIQTNTVYGDEKQIFRATA